MPLTIDLRHSARRYVESGDLKRLAGVSADPLPGAESAPTRAAAFPGGDAIAFNAAVGPAGIPAAVLDRLSADVSAVLASRASTVRAKPFGIDAKGNTPAELWTWIQDKIEKWHRIVTAAHIMAD